MKDLAPVKSLAISFFLNDKSMRLAVPPDMNTLELLRDRLGMTGTKESCAEGDCGACTVTVGGFEQGRLVYRAINSCLYPAARLHGRHLVTIEGLTTGRADALAPGDQLHLIQQAILDHHATQCGYCTPGIVMSLFALFINQPNASATDIIGALEGNLCRCTGYESVRRAAREVARSINRKGPSKRGSIVPAYFTRIAAALKQGVAKPNESTEPGFQDRFSIGYRMPSSLAELFAFLNESRDPSRVRLVNGATDLMVEMNVKRQFPDILVDISRIEELTAINERDGTVSIGAACTLAQIMDHPMVRQRIPLLEETIRCMASTQIRNLATLAGNVANASPVADGAVSLLALDARLLLSSVSGKRTIPLEKFYHDYKKTALRPGEIIAAIETAPPPGRGTFLKAAKRRVADIAAVNSACWLGTESGRVHLCRIAFGGVAVFPKLAEICASFLSGRELTTKTIVAAAALAAEEFVPISDVRGSASYRRLLIRNQVIAHLEQHRRRPAGEGGPNA